MGAMISAVLIASLGDRLPRGLLMLGGVTLYGLSVVAFAIVGLAHVTSWALVQTVIQNYSPSAFRGRTMAIFHMSDVVVIVGSLLAGTLAALWGALGKGRVPIAVENREGGSLLGPGGTLSARHDDRAGVGRGPPDFIPSGQ